MKKNKVVSPFLSKFFILFFVFLFLVFIANNNNISNRHYLKNDPAIIEKNIKVGPTEPPFDWSVKKVDDYITKINLPPDPRMSTVEELYLAMSDYRRAHNVGQVTRNDLLCDIAQKRAEEQLKNGGLDGHAGFDKYAKDQDEFYRMGEVLFGGVQPQYGVHIIEYGWDRSLTGHKEAIQDPSWNHGCGGVAGYYAVFIFGSK